ncbi:MMPL family transporter [Caldisphaera sp.]|uniref:MMPL family transporter n=1 Tax=Caldisphaera sp. TaxID=2060322 RepID=UPI003D110CFC
MYSKNRNLAYIIIIVALIIVLVFYPFMTKINSVVSTNESSMLPKNVESIEVMNIVQNESNASKQSNIIYLISGIPINLSSFYRLNGSIKYGNSWISILNSTYLYIQNTSNFLLNSSLSISNSIKDIWISTINLTDKLNDLKNNIILLSSLIRNSDYIYSTYYNLGNNLSKTYSMIKPEMILYGNITKSISLSYGTIYLNTLRVEYILYNQTNAYQTMNLTQNDILKVIENSPQINDVPPPSPIFIETLFNYVLSNGGPKNFNNEVANNFTYKILYQEMNQSNYIQALPILNLYSKYFYNTSLEFNINSLMNNLTIENQYKLYYIINEISNYSSVETFKSILSSLPISGEELNLIMNIGLKYASAGFNESILDLIIRNITYEILSLKIPSQIALNLSSYISNGSFNKFISATYAAKTIANYLPLSYKNYSNVILSYIPTVILSYDKNASLDIFNNKTLALNIAAKIVSNISNVSNSITQKLVNNESTYYLSISLISQKINNPKASILINELNSTEPIYNYTYLLIKMPNILNETLLKMGFPSNITPLLVSSTMNIIINSTPFNTEQNNITQFIFNKTFPTIINKIKGILVQNNLNGFAVFITENLSYSQALELKNDMLNSLKTKGFNNVSIMLTGTQILNYQLGNSSIKSISQSDFISTILVLIILAIVLEAIVAIVIPFIGIGIGLIIALGIGYILASHNIITLNSISRTIMYLAGLGLGIDYSSLISRRFREEYIKTGNSKLAAENALKRSWRAVITGALTAAIGFGSMAIASNFPFLASLGESAPISILITMTVSLTVIPSLLSIIGGHRIIWWPSNLKSNNKQDKPIKSRKITERSAIVLVIVFILLIPSIYIYTSFKGSYDFTLMMPQNSQAVTALHYLSNNYASGILYPDYIVAPNITVLQKINQSISKLSCIQSTQLINSSKPILQVTLSVYPLGKDAIICTENIREISKNISTSAMVGGEAAINLDLKNIVYHNFYHLVYPIAILLMFAILLIFFGSVPMALAALGSVVFSAIFGSTIAIEYYHIMGITLPWYLPIVVFTAILGVGMDYNSFIINRIREESENKDMKDAVSYAVGKMGVLVIGLSIIMAGAFSGLLAFSAPGFKGMGIALMSGVFIAGLMASYLFTPAIAYLLGNYVWWPTKLKRKN